MMKKKYVRQQHCFDFKSLPHEKNVMSLMFITEAILMITVNQDTIHVPCRVENIQAVAMVGDLKH